MNVIGGVLPYDSGSMKIEGKEYKPSNPQIAMEAGIAFTRLESDVVGSSKMRIRLFFTNALIISIIWRVPIGSSPTMTPGFFFMRERL